MTQEGAVYTYIGYWGGIGANINTTNSDAGAIWFEARDIESDNYQRYVGDLLIFTYHPSSNTLTTKHL